MKRNLMGGKFIWWWSPLFLSIGYICAYLAHSEPLKIFIFSATIIGLIFAGLDK